VLHCAASFLDRVLNEHASAAEGIGTHRGSPLLYRSILLPPPTTAAASTACSAPPTPVPIAQIFADEREARTVRARAYVHQQAIRPVAIKTLRSIVERRGIPPAPAMPRHCVSTRITRRRSQRSSDRWALFASSDPTSGVLIRC
jgi:hypothetical protein